MNNGDERKNVYCEIGFLDEYAQAKPKSIAPDDIRLIRWIETFQFISRSNLHFDISLSDLNNRRKENEYLARLWKKSSGGLCGLECDWNGILQLQEQGITTDEMYSSVYLVCKKNCNQMKDFAKGQGVLLLDINSLLNEEKWYETREKTVSKTPKSFNPEKGETIVYAKPNSDRSYWKHFLAAKHNCNALSIIDGYLMKSEELIFNNLIPLLNVFLPTSLENDISFHISLITNYDKESNAEQIKSELKRNYQLIDGKLKEIRPQLNYKLGLFNMKGLLHDRHLLTNYLYVTSGAGFGLIAKDVKSDNPYFINRTKVDVLFPFSIANNSNAEYEYYSLCQEVKKVLQKEDRFLSEGDRHNRLFYQFEKTKY